MTPKQFTLHVQQLVVECLSEACIDLTRGDKHYVLRGMTSEGSFTLNVPTDQEHLDKIVVTYDSYEAAAESMLKSLKLRIGLYKANIFCLPNPPYVKSMTVLSWPEL